MKNISTHTLRGERDHHRIDTLDKLTEFQLTRSVGSVTCPWRSSDIEQRISTHTLRGERDLMKKKRK